MTKRKYDGFHFLPDPEQEDSFIFQFFHLTNTSEVDISDEPIGGNNLGDMFDVLLMKEKEDGVELYDIFQAIFADPEVYAEGLVGSNVYGTFVRKTEISKVWWENYVEKTKVMIDKVNSEGV
jgi:hypothetical protein